MNWLSRHRRAVLCSAWLLGAGLLIWCWAAVYYRSYMDRVHGGIAAHREGGSPGVKAFFHGYEAEDHTWHYVRAVVEEVPHAGYVIDLMMSSATWRDRWFRPLNLRVLGVAVGYLVALPVGLVVVRRRHAAGSPAEPDAVANGGL